MTKEDQNIFYNIVSQRLTTAMSLVNHDSSLTAKAVGEQRNTINHLLEGRPTSLHHLVWLTKTYEIDFQDVLAEFHTKAKGTVKNGKNKKGKKHEAIEDTAKESFNPFEGLI